MWKRLSLRAQLFFSLGAMFVAALIMGVVLLQMFATDQLMDEHEPARRAAQVMADALNNTLGSSENPRRTLQAFVQSLDGSAVIQFRPAESVPPPPSPTPLQRPHGVPRWFIDLLAIPEVDTAFPVTIEGRRVGDIVFLPDLSADLFEKWVGFLAFGCLVVLLMALTGIIAYAIAGSALRPLRNLGKGLTQMRGGDYAQMIPVEGPPEIRQGCEEANALARTLNSLSQDNRHLLRQLVSLQDYERQGLARELHDELGPLLFGIRASTVALAEAIPPAMQGLGASAQQVLQSVEALQQTNRRILDRLRPLYIQELGLERSLQTLLQNVRTQAPQLKLTATIDPALNTIDGPSSQTVYRVIQEALTNVLRHAGASSAHVEATIVGDEVALEISDDGAGFPADNVFGRGLTGMNERVRALSGSLLLSRADERTCVRCRLPIGTAPSAPCPPAV
jgi:signal transduction histidine kinase